MYVTFPRISFGIIVLNGEPFTKYNLRQIYPYAHEIIVVEGGSEKAQEFAPNGYSTDGTLENLYEFKAEEDPEDKVKIITKRGFWSEKDEQSRAYAKVATGDYLWQVDIDEFYLEEDMEYIIELLRQNRDVNLISFKQLTFWGGFDYWCDSIYLRNAFTEIRRIFRWDKGYQYVSHRPPTILDDKGTDLATKTGLNADRTSKEGLYMYHYSLVFPKQVKEKCQYYSRPGGAFRSNMDKWAEECYFRLGNPFKVHNVFVYPSWLNEYSGNHPRQIRQLMADISIGNVSVETRDGDDVRSLMKKPGYHVGIQVLKMLDGLLVFRLLLFLRRLILRYLPKASAR